MHSGGSPRHAGSASLRRATPTGAPSPSSSLNGSSSVRRPTTGASPRPPTKGGAVSDVAHMRAAMAACPLRTVVREVIHHLAVNKAFGSPLTVLQEEYAEFMRNETEGESALRTSAHATQHETSASALTRSELQTQFLSLHTSYTKLAAESLAKDERINRLKSKVMDLSADVNQLRRAAINAGSAANATASSGELSADASERVSSHDVITSLEKLNLELSERNEMLEHNMGIGMVYCASDVEHTILQQQADIDKLLTNNATLAEAYLRVYETQASCEARAVKAESELGFATKRKDQLEKEVLALRVALERSKVHSMS